VKLREKKEEELRVSSCLDDPTSLSAALEDSQSFSLDHNVGNSTLRPSALEVKGMDDLLMSEEEVTSQKPSSGYSRLQKDMILKKFMEVKKPKNAGNKTVMVIP
jgi:hypothetical protein